MDCRAGYAALNRPISQYINRYKREVQAGVWSHFDGRGLQLLTELGA